MKKDLHPKLNKIKVQMSDGSEFETLQFASALDQLPYTRAFPRRFDRVCDEEYPAHFEDSLPRQPCRQLLYKRHRALKPHVA